MDSSINVINYHSYVFFYFLIKNPPPPYLSFILIVSSLLQSLFLPRPLSFASLTLRWGSSIAPPAPPFEPISLGFRAASSPPFPPPPSPVIVPRPFCADPVPASFVAPSEGRGEEEAEGGEEEEREGEEERGPSSSIRMEFSIPLLKNSVMLRRLRLNREEARGEEGEGGGKRGEDPSALPIAATRAARSEALSAGGRIACGAE